MKCPRRRRPTWAWSWPYIRWILEELRGGKWVELNIDPAVERAYSELREVLDRPGTTAGKKADVDAALKLHAETLRKLNQRGKV